MTTHSLVTFLGRVPRSDGGRYEHVEHRFPDGASSEAAFLCFPLRNWLQADRLVVLGTAGSMWDNLFEGLGDDDALEHERLALLEESDAERVTQARLDTLAPWLARRYGHEVELRIIPRGADLEDQTALLHELAQAAPKAGRLSIDVTHGFRHLPMVGLTAALYLRALDPNLDVGLWYGEMGGANDTGTKTVQVRDLAGLLITVKWLEALQREQLLGDYQGVADIVEENGDSELAGYLRHASHYQNIHQEYKARGYVENALGILKDKALEGPGALFQNALVRRMAWASESSRYRRQRRNALDALARKDYMRATLIGREAFVTRLTEDVFGEEDVFAQERRKEALDLFHQDGTREDKRAYSRLNGIRNVIAYANRPEHDNRKTEDAVKSAIKTQTKLHQALTECFHRLLPDRQ